MTPEQVVAIVFLVTYLVMAVAWSRVLVRPPVDLDSLLVVTDGKKQPTRAEIERDLMRDPAEWVREAEEAVERENR